MKSVIIIGNSITAEVLYNLIKEDDRYKVKCFAVDREFMSGNKFQGLKVVDINDIPQLFNNTEVKIIIAVGYNNVNQDREVIYSRLRDLNFEIETYIHQDALVHTKDIGNGCIILPGSVVDPCCKIGENTVIWSNVICAHHTIIEDNCWVASGSILSGQTKIGKNTFICVGAIIVNEVNIGEYNIIGAGSLITKNTGDNEVYLTKAGERIPFDSFNYAKVYGY